MNILGIGKIIKNTPFNVRGEPIVCTPMDAVHCFLKTDIDYLVIGHFLVRKNTTNPTNLWKNRLWWMVPPIIVFLLFGALIAFSTVSPVSPFAYMLF